MYEYSLKIKLMRSIYKIKIGPSTDPKGMP